MSFAVIGVVFPVIFIGELPDKTMFASLVMSTRGRPLSVWIGSAAAFAVHVVIATTVGVALFHVLPHRVVEGAVAFLFFAGAVLAFVEGLRERKHEEKQDELVATEAKALGRRTVLTAFLVIFLAEWGDLTQILTANLAAKYHSALSVGVGAVLALWSVSAIAVVGGQNLLRFVNVVTVRFVTAVVLLGLTGYATWGALR
jgi:Ca2+/H+ antiporter, TMEM165/GDT1 family